ncbi:NAD-dependent epimerase/dehydratase family protein [[Clostridium] fimetarium]|uniref:Nucleoside-diphosphate-sugar epimerase n=1 Tax=[Clostridium] fimetarium TaxID=99656 RepID=A0A1I0PKZ9_9FIRM|nr:NAD(P)-dependent oxidoreductase [[Clostridium] fimetarium]SEW15097.1 Nucleoside-diphosphate-sugar epimerase [[Clostridium] fimetarium]
MKKVVITGVSGRLGPYVVEHFVEMGYDVLGVDITKPKQTLSKFMTVNLMNIGECYGALAGADAVVHLAAIPVAYSHPNEVTFQNNVMTTYNILEAAAGLGIKKAVIASSESSYGIVFTKQNMEPQYVPMDEDHPQRPEDCYGLSKIVAEKTAEMINHRCGMQIVSLRIGNIIATDMYKNFPGFIRESNKRRNILWSYVDARDIAVACRLAIETEGLGYIALNLSADDTSMDIKSSELMKAEFPEVKDIRVPLDNYHTLLSNEKAKKVLNWQPIHSWRDNISNI